MWRGCTRCWLWPIFASVAVCFSSHIAWSQPARLYDLESLAFQADEIVEGDLVYAGSYTFILKVSAVHLGKLVKDQLIVCSGERSFSLPANRDRFDEELEFPKGSHFWLFLKPTELDPEQFGVPPGTLGFEIVGNGLKFEKKERVYGFHRSDFDDYVADAPFGGDAEGKFETFSAFSDAMIDAQGGVAEIKEKFGADASSDDTPWLLEVIKSRKPLSSDSYFHDAIAEAAAERLVAINDLEAIFKVLREREGWDGVSDILFSRLGSADAKELLDAKISDHSQAERIRVLCATALAKADAEHLRNGKAPVDNLYLSRLTDLVLLKFNEEAVTLELLKAVKQRILWANAQNRTESTAAVEASFKRLAEYHKTTPTEPIRYALEDTAATVDPAAYSSLNSSCGPVISQVSRAVLVSDATRPAYMDVEFQFRWLGDGSAVDRVTCVLKSVDTGKEYELIPTAPRLSHRANAYSGIDHPDPPADLIPGRYRVFYRFRSDQTVVSEGHFVEVDLHP